MSLIHTAELNGVEPFPYLVTLMRHADTVAKEPAAWFPWNYPRANGRTPGPEPGPGSSTAAP